MQNCSDKHQEVQHSTINDDFVWDRVVWKEGVEGEREAGSSSHTVKNPALERSVGVPGDQRRVQKYSQRSLSGPNRAAPVRLRSRLFSALMFEVNMSRSAWPPSAGCYCPAAVCSDWWINAVFNRCLENEIRIDKTRWSSHRFYFVYGLLRDLNTGLLCLNCAGVSLFYWPA